MTHRHFDKAFAHAWNSRKLTIADMADSLDMSAWAIRQLAKVNPLCVHPKPKRVESRVSVEKIAELILQGVTYAEIARIAGYKNPETVIQMAKRRGIWVPRYKPRGDKS